MHHKQITTLRNISQRKPNQTQHYMNKNLECLIQLECWLCSNIHCGTIILVMMVRGQRPWDANCMDCALRQPMIQLRNQFSHAQYPQVTNQIDERSKVIQTTENTKLLLTEWISSLKASPLNLKESEIYIYMENIHVHLSLTRG